MDTDSDKFWSAFSELWDGIKVMGHDDVPSEFLGTATWVSGNEDVRDQACRSWAQEALSKLYFN